MVFTLQEHVRGLVLSLLSNQRQWLPIAEWLAGIDGYGVRRSSMSCQRNSVSSGRFTEFLEHELGGFDLEAPVIDSIEFRVPPLHALGIG